MEICGSYVKQITNIIRNGEWAVALKSELAVYALDTVDHAMQVAK